MDRKLRLPAHLWQTIIACVEKTLPEEACGLLAGMDDTIQAAFPVTNLLHRPDRFQMDPVEQYEVFRWIDERGLELLGIFHSHPSGPEAPSKTDLAEFAYPGVAYLIVFLREQAWQSRIFDIRDGNYTEITLEVIEKEA
jgi:proteasome lid subunit RPN8/RPN11